MDPPWRSKVNHSKEFKGNRQQANTSHQKDAYARLVSQHHSSKFTSYLDKYTKEISSLNVGNTPSLHNKAQSELLDIPQRKRDQVLEDFSDSSDFSPCFMKTEAGENLLPINLDQLSIQGSKTKKGAMQDGQNMVARGQRRDTTTSRDGDIESGEELSSLNSPDIKKHQKQQRKTKNSKKTASQNVDSGGEFPSHCSEDLTSGLTQENEKKGNKKSVTKETAVVKNKEGPVRACAADNKLQQKGQSSPADKGRNKGVKKQVFESYMATEEVSHGLKRGELIQGQIRINPKKYHEAFISSPQDDMHDIFLDGIVARNRALNGDIVVVQMLPQDQWKLGRSDTDCERESETQAEHFLQKTRGPADCTMGSRGDQNNESLSRALEVPPTGGTPEEPSALQINREKILKTAKVVYIVEKKHSRAVTGFLKLIQDKPFAKFSPVDHRVPRINVPLSDCPDNFRFRPDDYANTLFICRITNWAADCNFAEGRLAKTLGQAGTIEPETEGILTEYDVDFTEFSNEVLDCLPKNLPWTIPPEELKRRRDLRSQCIFTIDPSTARDLDDALSCKQLEDGNFEVGVHIADVSYFIEQGNALDAIASQRATSVYMVQKVIPMLPRLLCEELCSLNPLADRLTFSVIWKITPQGKILSEWFGRSVIRSCVKLSYDHAQSMIDSPEKLFSVEELPPVDPEHPVDEIHQAVLNLHLIAKNLRAQRFSGGALRLDQMKLSFTLDKETMMPQGCFVYQYRDSNKLVEEFMLLANIATAHHIFKKFPKLALLRRHPPPKVKMMEELQELCDQLELDIDMSSSGALHASLNSAVGDDEYTCARKDVLTHMCSRPMQMALYFCTGVLSDEKLFKHYALNVPLYTHFTSPIRRYADIIVHRLLASSLNCGPHLEQSTMEVEKQASHCNHKKSLSKKVQELSTELFFGVYVKECGPLDSEAMVMWVLDQSFDVLVLRYGMQRRVYCKMIEGLKSFHHHKVGKKSELTLVWKQENPEVPPVTQVISIFTLVEVQLKAGGDQMKYSAELKKPEGRGF